MVKSKRQYTFVGGKTIIGRIFAYQEKTGMSYKEIMKMSYIVFVLGMLDAPQIDYDSKKDKETKLESAESQVNAILNVFK